jgi:hypothetical protein
VAQLKRLLAGGHQQAARCPTPELA